MGNCDRLSTYIYIDVASSVASMDFLPRLSSLFVHSFIKIEVWTKFWSNDYAGKIMLLSHVVLITSA